MAKIETSKRGLYEVKSKQGLNCKFKKLWPVRAKIEECTENSKKISENGK